MEDPQSCSSSELSLREAEIWLHCGLSRISFVDLSSKGDSHGEEVEKKSAHHPFKALWHQRSARSKCLWCLVNSCVIANRKLQREKDRRLSSGPTLTFPSTSWRFVKCKIFENLIFRNRERERERCQPTGPLWCFHWVVSPPSAECAAMRNAAAGLHNHWVTRWMEVGAALWQDALKSWIIDVDERGNPRLMNPGPQPMNANRKTAWAAQRHQSHRLSGGLLQ